MSIELLIRVVRVIRVNPRFRGPHPPLKQLLHHPLFDGDGFISALLQCGDLGIHVGEDSSDGALFYNILQASVKARRCRTRYSLRLSSGISE